jgi:hypothetical protein
MDGVDILDPRFRPYVLPNAPLVELGAGFAWLEGPVWFADRNCLLVSDLPNDRIMRWTPDGSMSVFRSPAGFANGHTRDQEGRLLGCSHRQRAITRTELDGSITVLADRYAGKRLNSPNDLICKSDGSIWFTDPPYGISTDYEGGKQTPELPPALYRLDPKDGALSVMADDFEGPNGSPSRLTSGCSTSLKAAASSRPIRCSISASSTSSRTAAGSRPGASSTRSRPALPMASVSMRTAISGAAPPTGSTASRRTAPGSG